MNPKQLSELSDFQLLDLRLPDDYEAAHLAAALNNCVFEVSFHLLTTVRRELATSPSLVN